jgi:methylthioxylose transferase
VTIWRRRLLPIGLVCAAGGVVWWSVAEGRAEQRVNSGLKLGAAPLVGRDELDGWVWRWSWSLLAAGLLALLIAVAHQRGWWWRVRQRSVLLATSLGAMLFGTLLALGDGIDGLRYGAEHKTEYLANLATAPPAGEFVRTFVDEISRYSVHVRGHPPGFVLVLKFLDAIGLSGVWPVVGLSILGTGVTAAAVLLAVRSVAGDEWMRRAAPLLIVAPFGIWMQTSGDAVFTAVGALGIAAVAAGVSHRRAHAAWFGVAAGLLFGCLLFLTYLGGTLLLVPAVLLVAALRRREAGSWSVIVGGLAAGLGVIAAFWLAGFWWLDGVQATDEQYRLGSAQFRRWSYFAIGNIGAAVLALGPVTVLGLGVLRNRRMWLLVGGALAAVLVSHLSRYTKAEVERIWLVFYPWIAIAGAALIPRARAWAGAMAIGVQATCAIVLQAALLTKW